MPPQDGDTPLECAEFMDKSDCVYFLQKVFRSKRSGAPRAGFDHVHLRFVSLGHNAMTTGSKRGRLP